MTIKVVPLPTAGGMSPKEDVLAFLDKLRADVDTGVRPITDVVMVAIEQTEFTDKVYALSTTGLNPIEIIGHLFATATAMTMEGP